MTTSAPTRTAPTVVRIPGYWMIITPDCGRVVARALPVRPGAEPVKAIQCTTCTHLRGTDLPSMGKVCTCRLGFWRKPGSDKPLWLTFNRLLTTAGPIARIAASCTDHTPQEEA